MQTVFRARSRNYRIYAISWFGLTPYLENFAGVIPPDYQIGSINTAGASPADPSYRTEWLCTKSQQIAFSVQPLCSLCLCGLSTSQQNSPQRHREHRGCTENDLIIGHIGDSRAYLLHAGKLVQLTHDHTAGGMLVASGTHSPNDQLVIELRALLFEALGSREGECNPDVLDFLHADEAQLLLCTDGLTDMVDDVDIELILKSARSAKSACRALVDMALKNGGRDNVTVIVARYSIPPSTLNT